MGVRVNNSIGAFVIGLIVAMMLPTTALAQDHGAEVFVQDLANRATAMLGNPENNVDDVVAEFQTLLVENVALRNFGRSALGPYSRVATEEEFEQYIELLEQYATSVIRGRFEKYSGQTVIVTGSSVDVRTNFAYVSVESDILSVEGDHLASIRWLLIRRERDYRIYDITVETPDESGTFSLLQTQREEFNSIISSHGGRVRALLRYLRDRIRENGMTPANEATPRRN